MPRAVLPERGPLRFPALFGDDFCVAAPQASALSDKVALTVFEQEGGKITALWRRFCHGSKRICRPMPLYDRVVLAAQGLAQRSAAYKCPDAMLGALMLRQAHDKLIRAGMYAANTALNAAEFFRKSPGELSTDEISEFLDPSLTTVRELAIRERYGERRRSHVAFPRRTPIVAGKP